MLYNSNIFWNLKQDHSKWTICDKKKVVCIGDLNRMTSQRNRGGNFFCWENDDMWTGFYKLISQIGVCGES